MIRGVGLGIFANFFGLLKPQCLCGDILDEAKRWQSEAIGGAEPDEHHRSRLIDISHKTDLLVPLRRIGLIDGDSIYPQYARSIWATEAS